ncbi:MAG: hypothetical protein JWM62_358 [Frankiales bacterium]|nr:hypothetical protein [Frankiales bacterium]
MLNRMSRDDDRGIAMVMVVVSMMVLTMLATSALAYALTTQKSSRRDQDWNAALAAAQAGVEDYIGHLNRSDDYARVWDCTNKAQQGPAATGNTCGWTASTPPAWVRVAGGSGADFHYDVDPTRLAENGTIRVVSTGRSKGVTRTLDVAVGRGGSTDFLYYTTYEHADPANRGVYATPPSSSWCSGVDSAGQEVKQIYWWAGRSSAQAGCTEIQFAAGDVLDGRVHVNDTPLIGGGATFKEGLETSNPACKTAVASNNYAACQRGTGAPTYGVAPRWADELYLQDNSAQFATFPGCQYTGPTRVVLKSNGTMDVWSKWSTGAAAVAADCGGAAVTTAAGATNVPVPDGKVLYVRNGGEARQCAAGEIGDGLPLTGDTTMRLADQFCNMGNLYIEGTLKGRMSVAANNSIVVTGDLLLASGIDGVDMLGLVAANSVQAFHPWIERVTQSGDCVSWQWTRTQQVELVTPNITVPVGHRVGWEDGRFDDPRNPTAWTSGRWITKSTSSQQYRGLRREDDELRNGSWQNESSNRRWVPSTWVRGSDGRFNLVNGSWTTTTDAAKYYQGEQWQRGACLRYENQTITYGEASGWPHRSGGRATDIQIYGSIQTLQHSFFVQNYNKGTSQGKLSVWGSIAQKWRGIVGQTGTGCSPCGYLKDYRYDKRLKYSSPPYFPQWSNAQWGARYTGEVSPRYRS